MKHKKYLFLIVAASLVAVTQTSRAQTITDNFEDGDYTNSPTWYVQSTGSSSVLVDGTFGSNVFRMDPAFGFGAVLPLTSTYNLSATDKITVSIQFRDGNGDRGFITRLSNDNGSTIGANGSTSPGFNDAADDMGIGAQLSNTPGEGIRVIGETGTDGSHFFGSDREFKSYNAVAAFGTTVHTLRMDYFLDGSGDIQVDTFWDSSLLSSETFSQTTYANLITNGFNQFSVFGGGGTGATFFDNFSITQVPEPSTYALLTLGGGALWLLRRRSNQ